MQSRVVARGVFVRGGNILLAQLRDRPNIYYLPGGSVEEGEIGIEALEREMQEEIGAQTKGLTLIGAIEYRFDHGKRTEVNLIYIGSIPSHFKTRSRKEIFSWHPLATLNRIPFFPKSLVPVIKAWQTKKQRFIICEDRGARK